MIEPTETINKTSVKSDINIKTTSNTSNSEKIIDKELDKKEKRKQQQQNYLKNNYQKVLENQRDYYHKKIKKNHQYNTIYYKNGKKIKNNIIKNIKINNDADKSFNNDNIKIENKIIDISVKSKNDKTTNDNKCDKDKEIDLLKRKISEIEKENNLLSDDNKRLRKQNSMLKKLKE